MEKKKLERYMNSPFSEIKRISGYQEKFFIAILHTSQNSFFGVFGVVNFVIYELSNITNSSLH